MRIFAVAVCSICLAFSLLCGLAKQLIFGLSRHLISSYLCLGLNAYFTSPTEPAVLDQRIYLPIYALIQ